MKKVLIVEDDQILVKMYRRKFLAREFEVDIARDGEEGITKMQTFQPDIVLMDIMMPKLSGLDALDRIKQDPSISHIPVIILTNLSTTDDAQAAFKKGAVNYFVKSNFTPTEIVEKVNETLQNKSSKS